MPRWLKGLVTGFACALLGVLVGLSPLGAAFEQHVGLTWLFQIRGPVESPSEVSVVGIDARTGRELGIAALPRDWSRSVHARLIRNLTSLGASTIIFDIDFRRPKTELEDQDLADAVAAADGVVMFQRLEGKRLPIELLGDAVESTGEDVPAGSVWIEELLAPNERLAPVADAFAPFPLPKVQEAVYQYWAFKPSAGGVATLPSAGLQIYSREVHPQWRALLVEAGVPESQALDRWSPENADAGALRAHMDSMQKIFRQEPGLGARIKDRIADSNLAPREEQMVDALTRLYAGRENRYLNFYGPAGSIHTVAYHAVAGELQNIPDRVAKRLKGGVVFVGFSDLYDPGQPDRFYTVFTREDGVDLSGVEIAATALSNLLDGTQLEPAGPALSIAVLTVLGFSFGFTVYFFPALFAVPAALVGAVVYVWIAQRTFAGVASWLPLATPILIQLPFALLTGLLAQYLFERKQKQHATEALAYYLPEQAARDLTLGGRIEEADLNKSVYATCLATDMAGFSTIAETMSPGELASFMNQYFEALAEPLKLNGVSVTEFRADAIMCAWTADQPELDVRLSPIKAALGAVDAINRFSEAHSPRPLQARIGLESGWVYVGHAGGGGHFVYSIVGDSANTAARIESLNKHLQTQLLATATVLEGVEEFLLRPLGSFILMGKREPTLVVEVLAESEHGTEAQVRLCSVFSNALQKFHDLQWEDAARAFERILGEFPTDGPSRFYLGRCQRYVADGPPSENAASIHMDSK